jgi:hypothetical protein
MNNADIEELITQYLPIKKIEKDANGEVFTPPQLIHLVLDTYPQKVWSNPNLTWLDPSGGIGNFLIIVYQRLMKGLTTWETNNKKRSDHIIGKMLYMVEINRTNYNVCKRIFGSTMHLLCADFLQSTVYPDLLFDCIVGNPPFQDNYGLSNTGKRILGGKNKLYERIFLKAFSMLRNGGFLSFIVPDNIFSGNGSHSYKIIMQQEIPFVSFNSINNSFFPHIQQYICYFLLHKTNVNANAQQTIIENQDGATFHITLQDRPVNPIRNWTPVTEKLITKYVSTTRNNVMYNRGKNLSYYKGIKYPIIYSPFKNISTNNESLAVGLGHKKAVIFAISTDLLFQMDYSGNYGVGPNTFYIPFATNVEGKRIEQFLNSDDYKTLALATKTTRQYLKIAFIEHIAFSKIIKKNTKTIKHTNINHIKKNITNKNYKKQKL